MVKRCIVNVSIGARYQRMAPRLLQSLAKVEDPCDVLQWVNCFPPGAPTNVPMPIGGYTAKPFAMLEAARLGYVHVLWLDSACYAIRHTLPVFDEIGSAGYYVQQNDWIMGEWCSDAALETLNLSREQSMEITECSSMALGLDFRRPESVIFVNRWAALARDGVTFHGAHSNDIGPGPKYRSEARVSNDPRVRGHRHDQTAASYLVWSNKWKPTPRPVYVDYLKTTPDKRTVIVNHGI